MSDDFNTLDISRVEEETEKDFVKEFPFDAFKFERPSVSNPRLKLDPDQDWQFDGLVPIGGILEFNSGLTGVPTLTDSFHVLDGSVLSDSESCFDGQTLPNTPTKIIRIK